MKPSEKTDQNAVGNEFQNIIRTTKDHRHHHKRASGGEVDKSLLRCSYDDLVSLLLGIIKTDPVLAVRMIQEYISSLFLVNSEDLQVYSYFLEILSLLFLWDISFDLATVNLIIENSKICQSVIDSNSSQNDSLLKRIGLFIFPKRKKEKEDIKKWALSALSVANRGLLPKVISNFVKQGNLSEIDIVLGQYSASYLPYLIKDCLWKIDSSSQAGKDAIAKNKASILHLKDCLYKITDQRYREWLSTYVDMLTGEETDSDQCLAILDRFSLIDDSGWFNNLAYKISDVYPGKNIEICEYIINRYSSYFSSAEPSYKIFKSIWGITNDLIINPRQILDFVKENLQIFDTIFSKLNFEDPDEITSENKSTDGQAKIRYQNFEVLSLVYFALFEKEIALADRLLADMDRNQFVLSYDCIYKNVYSGSRPLNDQINHSLSKWTYKCSDKYRELFEIFQEKDLRKKCEQFASHYSASDFVNDSFLGQTFVNQCSELMKCDIPGTISVMEIVIRTIEDNSVPAGRCYDIPINLFGWLLYYHDWTAIINEINGNGTVRDFLKRTVNLPDFIEKFYQEIRSARNKQKSVSDANMISLAAYLFEKEDQTVLENGDPSQKAETVFAWLKQTDEEQPLFITETKLRLLTCWNSVEIDEERRYMEIERLQLIILSQSAGRILDVVEKSELMLLDYYGKTNIRKANALISDYLNNPGWGKEAKFKIQRITNEISEKSRINLLVVNSDYREALVGESFDSDCFRQIQECLINNEFDLLRELQKTNNELKRFSDDEMLGFVLKLLNARTIKITNAKQLDYLSEFIQPYSSSSDYQKVLHRIERRKDKSNVTGTN